MKWPIIWHFVCALVFQSQWASAQVYRCDHDGHRLSGALAPRFARCQIPTRIATRSGCALMQLEQSREHIWHADDFHEGSRITQSTCGHAPGHNNISVTCVDEDSQLAQVRCANGSHAPMWVNVDNLECVEHNVSTYVPPRAPASRPPCPENASLQSAREASRQVAVLGMGSPDVRMRVLQEAGGAYNSCAIRTALSHFSQIQNYQIQDHQRLLNEYGLSNQAGVEPTPISDDELARRLARARQSIHERLARVQNIITNDCQTLPNIRGASQAINTQMQLAQVTCRMMRNARATLDEIQGTGHDSPALIRQRFNEHAMTVGEQNTDSNPYQLAMANVLYMGLAQPPQLQALRLNSELTALEGLMGIRQGRPFTEHHSGYSLGGSRLGTNRGAMDCSEFISRVYGLRRGGSAPTTADIMQASRHLEDPARVPGVFGPWRGLESCFHRVDIRAGEQIMPGDLVLERQHGQGHVVMVLDYDPETSPRVIHTIEAAGGTMGTVGFSRRSLFEPVCGGEAAAPTAIRPTLSVLRFDGSDHRCPATPPPSSLNCGR